MTYPKIGIRPVIDGRWGGIRESLEAKTMTMAKLAAELIDSGKALETLEKLTLKEVNRIIKKYLSVPGKVTVLVTPEKR